MSLFSELKRRNVLRVGAAYLAVAWLIVQIVETLFPIFGISDTAIRTIVVLLAIGFLPVLALSWFLEWTPQGIKLDDDVDHDSALSRHLSRRVDRFFIGALLLALGLFAFNTFYLEPLRDKKELEVAREQAREEGRAEAEAIIRDNTIAVLPFQDLSASADQQFLCDGLAQDIIGDLSRIAQLRVTARTSAFSFREKRATISEIGEALNVSFVLEGSISRSGERIRVSVQLVDTRSETALWSEDFDRTLEDIFDIRDEISEKVVARMPMRGDISTGASRRTDARAYALTLRARGIMNSPEGKTMEAKGLLEQALQLDPDYVPALIDAMYANYDLVSAGKLDADEERVIGDELLHRALTLEPGNGIALALRAYSSWEVENDWEAAAEQLTAALAAAPGNVEVLRLAGVSARRAGKHAEAVMLLERVAALDPLYARNLFQLPQAYLSAGRYEDAVDWYVRQERVSGGSTYYLGLALLLQGNPDSALAAYEAAGMPPGHPQALALRTMIMHDLGRTEQRDTALSGLAAIGLEDIPWTPYLVAQAYAWIGESDLAFEWIDSGIDVDQRYGVTGWWFRQILFLPVWQNLHADPRWDAARERVGMSAERMDAIESRLRLPIAARLQPNSLVTVATARGGN